MRRLVVALLGLGLGLCGSCASQQGHSTSVRTTLAHHRVTYLPNATTPGMVNAAVTQDDLATTVCHAGWSTEQRQKYAPSSVTGPIRDRELSTTYAYEHLTSKDVEEDHRVPISVGGALADQKNLWPEPHAAAGPDGQPAGSTQKDGLEWFTYRQLCAGKITLRVARSWFLGNWYHWYVKSGRPKSPGFFH